MLCFAWWLGTLLGALWLPACGSVQVAPNAHLGSCLTPEWVQAIEAKTGFSSTERDALGRLQHPHLHAAFKHVRFTVDDPRTKTVEMDKLFQPSCVAGNNKIYGVGAQVDPSDGSVLNRGRVNGSLIVELRGWATHVLTTQVFAILVRELLGYDVSIFKTSNAQLMAQRMSSVQSGRCAPVHANVEVWRYDDTYANESYRAGGVGYFGRSGLFSTSTFIEDGTDPAKYSPPFSADFWRDYRSNEKLLTALSVYDFKNNSKYYPPREIACADGTVGCKDGCSKTDTCTAFEAQGKTCMVVVMMNADYDTGYFEAVLANKKIPSYHCFIGADALEAYAVEAYANKTPVVFYHYEPDPLHFVHEGKFERVFLPRSKPELAALTTKSFGENGYGGKTTNPVAVDFESTNLGKYAASIVQEQPMLGTLISRMTIGELDINSLLKMYLAATVFYIFLALALLVCTALVMAMMLVPKVIRLNEQLNEQTDRTQTSAGGDETTQAGKRSVLRLPMRPSKAAVTPVVPFASKKMSSPSNNTAGPMSSGSGWSQRCQSSLAYRVFEDAATGLEPTKTAFVLHGILDAVMGHSFGGKVAIKYMDECVRQGWKVPEQVWVLDSLPGSVENDYAYRKVTASIERVLPVLKSIPLPIHSKKQLITDLTDKGISIGEAQWLTTNLKMISTHPETYTWKMSVPVIEDLFQSFLANDLWPAVEATPDGTDIHFVQADRSRMWTPAVAERLATLRQRKSNVHHYVLPNSDHWVHIDNPDGLLQIMLQNLPN
ncbi:hypothetical protein ATCC90586_006842 [Pythium insidiosum]|nr:hypothetical protein ATCC90586_006842 [Pythium insidiosum]